MVRNRYHDISNHHAESVTSNALYLINVSYCNVWDNDISRQLVQNHGCRCFGSLRRQVTAAMVSSM